MEKFSDKDVFGVRQDAKSMLIAVCKKMMTKIPGLFVPLHFRSRECKTIERTFALVELSFHGTFATWNFRWKDYTMCTAAKTYEIGQNRLKLAE